MSCLVPVNTKEDIFPKYRNTPIADLLEYHDLGKPFAKYKDPKVLIGMCMDYRKKMHIPDGFAYIIRTGGGSVRHAEFKVSYSIAVGGVKAIALIGHDNCGMVNLASKETKFVEGLVEAGWKKDAALDHFRQFAPMYEICNELDFLLSETDRLRRRYPKILVAPLMYQVEDNRLYLIDEDKEC